MKIEFTITEAQEERVTNAFCSYFSYREPEVGEEGGETKPQFVKRMMVEWVKGIVRDREVKDLARSARADWEDISVS